MWSRPRTIAFGAALGQLFVGDDAWADVNVEGARARLERRDGLAGQIDLKLALRQGNVNVIDFAAASHLAFHRGRHFGILLSESRFGAQTTWRKGQTTADLAETDARIRNRHMGHLRYNYGIWKWIVAEGFVQLEADEFLLVSTRFLVGTGPRFVAHQGPIVDVAVGTSYMAEYEALDGDRLVRQRPPATARNWWHRWNTYVAVSIRPGERLRLIVVTYVQPRFDQPQDLRVSADGELALSLSKHWSFKLVAGLDYDSRPPIACASEIEPGSVCDAGDAFPLRSVDLAVQNAIALQF